ncbi:substrate-binding domain-containing protein [Microbacterium sp. NPDC019599]|uniref:substrate-binding domain-containing protein n=1 Tax=Microbacterium sp. NPDC019599 TaxID=3154690 RepID=UPI0033E87EBA
MDRRVTLADVAAAAGVSAGTASRVLARRGDFSAETRRAVLEAAGRLGYDRSTTLRGRRPHADPRLIELVIGGVGHPWADQVIVGAHERAFELGYDIVLTPERDDPADDWPARIAERRSSGVVLAIVTPTQRQLELLSGFSVPTVLLDPRSETDAALPSVGATNREGGFAAGRHLAGRGYEHFVYATWRLPYRFGRARERGFRDALAEDRPDAPVDTVSAEWVDGPARAGIDRLLEISAVRRLGVFAVNDDVAAAIAGALRAAGRRVPEDVGVIGFDDNPRYRSAGLSTVRQPLREMAARAVDLIDGLRRGEPVLDRHVELPTALIARRTT